MRYYSSNNKNSLVSIKDAVTLGIAPDKGLFMPENIRPFEKEFFLNLNSFSLQDIAYKVCKNFCYPEINEEDLRILVDRCFNFDAPLVQITNNIFSLELFHGPTLAFKDFGARFLAELLCYFTKAKTYILVATSGDTGGAVASSFFAKENINVVILFPKNKVSAIQEKQLTSLGKNIQAIEIEGTFDDCQRLVKSAFLDKELKDKLNFSSANSINIARLIPQSIYYFYAISQILKVKSVSLNDKFIFSVPSGNFGNLTAGLFANKLGLPVYKFIAALNSNDTFLKYLKTGTYQAKPSIETLSNAMDVGDPSNFVRMSDLFNHKVDNFRELICSYSFNDQSTKQAILELFQKYNYISDPHGAIGYLALSAFLAENNSEKYKGIFLETAHPAKFQDTVKNVIGHNLDLPPQLAELLNKKSHKISLSNKFEDFKNLLLDIE